MAPLPAGRAAVKRNKWSLRAFDAGKITLPELVENVLTDTFAADEDTWRESIAVIPTPLRTQFLDVSRSCLVSEDFMPPPGVILPPAKSHEEIQAIKQERRPRYLRLFQLIEEVCATSRSGSSQQSSAT